MKKILIFGLVLILLSSIVSAFNVTELNAGALAYYNYSSDLTDSVGAKDLTNFNTVATGSGKIGNAYEWDGGANDDYHFLGNANRWGIVNFSISFWAKRDDTTATQRSIMVHRNNDALFQIGQYFNNQNEIVLGFFDETTDTYIYLGCGGRGSGFNHFVMVYDEDSGIYCYTNGTLYNSSLGAYTRRTSLGDGIFIGRNSASNWEWDGVIDEIAVFDYVINETEASFLYDSGNPNNEQQFPFFYTEAGGGAGGSENNLTINLFDIWTNSTNINASVNISGKIFFGESIINTNITLNSTQEYELQFFNISHNTRDYFNRTLRYNLSNSTYEADAYLYPYTNITAISNLTGNSITNFTLYFDSVKYQTTTSEIYLPIYNQSYNLTIQDAQEGLNYFAFEEKNLTTPAYLNSFQFSLQPYNSVKVFIKNADDGTNITDNITIRVAGDSGENTYYRTNSTLFLKDLTAGNYTFRFSATNWTTRIYEIVVFNGSYQEFTAYLDKATEQVIFTTLDENTNAFITDVVLSVQRIIAGVWTTTATYTTDISGKTAFKYVEDVQYRFTASKTGYQSKTFTLNPILFSSYNIYLTPSVSIQDQNDYGGIGIVFTPKTFYDNQTNNFTFTISSPAGELTNFGYNISHSSGNLTNSGLNAYGSVLTSSFHINGSAFWDSLSLTYWYTLSDGTHKVFMYNYPIIKTDSIDEQSLINLKGQTFGLGVFERVLIAMFITFISAGVVGMLAGGVAGGVLGLGILGFLQYIGFLPLWTILPTFLIIFIWLIWRGSL